MHTLPRTIIIHNFPRDVTNLGVLVRAPYKKNGLWTATILENGTSWLANYYGTTKEEAIKNALTGIH